MKNEIIVKSLNSTYSIIIINEVKHIVSNSGWLPLEWWIKKFKEED